MKKLFILLLLTSSLFSASIYTLDNVKNLKLYFSNKSGFLDKEQKANIEKLIKTKLEDAGFVFGQTDAIVFVLVIEAIEVSDTHVINIQIGLGEEVNTKRKDNIETFAYTYLANDFMESSSAYEDTVERVEFLLYEFIQAYKDDNE